MSGATLALTSRACIRHIATPFRHHLRTTEVVLQSCHRCVSFCTVTHFWPQLWANTSSRDDSRTLPQYVCSTACSLLCSLTNTQLPVPCQHRRQLIVSAGVRCWSCIPPLHPPPAGSAKALVARFSLVQALYHNPDPVEQFSRVEQFQEPLLQQRYSLCPARYWRI